MLLIQAVFRIFYSLGCVTMRNVRRKSGVTVQNDIIQLTIDRSSTLQTQTGYRNLHPIPQHQIIGKKKHTSNVPICQYLQICLFTQRAVPIGPLPYVFTSYPESLWDEAYDVSVRLEFSRFLFMSYLPFGKNTCVITLLPYELET